MASFSCPHCGLSVVDIPVSLSGKRMKCKKCGGVFELPMFEGHEGFSEPLAAEVVKPASTSGFQAGPRTQNIAYAGMPGMAIGEPQSNKLAVVGLVLAILGILICWVPFLGSVLCLLALVLAIVGLVRANRGRSGKGVAVTGVVLGSLGMVLSIVLIPVMFTALGAVLIAVRVNQTGQQMVELQNALQKYGQQHRRFPDGLRDLPATGKNDDGSARDLTVDAWDNPFEYQRVAGQQESYRLWSRGPDGVSGTEDDVHPGDFQTR
jgi:type II secretory pathway pseudopilin PulG